MLTLFIFCAIIITAIGYCIYKLDTSRRYTGIKDITGRKIYTDDIVEMHYGKTCVIGKVGSRWGMPYTEQDGIRYYWVRPNQKFVVVQYNPCYHCLDGAYDRCSYTMCRHKSKRWAGDIEALTIGVDENIY